MGTCTHCSAEIPYNKVQIAIFEHIFELCTGMVAVCVTTATIRCLFFGSSSLFSLIALYDNLPARAASHSSSYIQDIRLQICFVTILMKISKSQHHHNTKQLKYLLTYCNERNDALPASNIKYKTFSITYQ